jgi:hypothetical protein
VSDREAMPRLRTIQWYWEEHRGTLTIFPDLPVRMIGWGEPFCFRCGWLAPVKDWAAYTQGSSEDKMTKVWNGAAGWLERCHLQDNAFGGSEQPMNLVPMCVACHEQQPLSETWATGVAYVNQHVRCPAGLQAMTDLLYMERRRNAESNKRRFWTAVRLADRAQYLSTVEALRTGEVPTVPSRDDPAYCWPAGPEKHVAMLSLVNQ